MGADLLLAYIPAAKITKPRRSDLHWIIDGLSEAEMKNEEIASLADDRDVRELLHEYVDLLPEHPGERRNLVEMALPHMPYPVLFTGGDSWGDAPGDLFEPFCCLAVLPTLFQQLRTWAIADEKFRRSGTSRRKTA